MACEYCNGTGWMHTVIERDGYTASAMQRCVCKTRAKAEEEKSHPGTFRAISEMIDHAAQSMLSDADRQVADLIREHEGRENAISIEDICKRLWPSAWFGGGSEDAVELHKKRNQLARSVKASVERLRTARIPVAASKGAPGGYYIPVTAEECDECHERLFSEGIKLIVLSRLFKPDCDLVAELRGQLNLRSGN